MKRKKEGKKKAAEPDWNQLGSIEQSVEEVTHYNYSCCICDKEEMEEEYMGADTVAKQLYHEGWRYGTSDKFQVEGLMCPDCYKTPDKDRGED